MASPSSNNTNSDNDPLEEKQEEDEDEDDSLELELGLGLTVARTKPDPRFSSASASSSSPFPTRFHSHSHQELGLGLGLGLRLGFDNESVGGSLCGAPLNNHCYLCHHVSSSTSTLLTSPLLQSSPSWAWHVDLGGLLQPENLLTPVYRSHDYHRRPETRSETGLWFSLHSSHNRREGDGLPQIPKAYIRVKDENVTVLTVKTYLVGKLGLTNEAEIDISCMGQKLLQSQTLMYVRDAVWLPRLLHSLNTTASMENAHDTSTNHLMSLHYGRRCIWDEVVHRCIKEVETILIYKDEDLIIIPI